MDWFVDTMCRAEAEDAKRIGQNVYAILNPLAEAVEPGCEGLLFFPYLLGERSLGTPHAHGTFFRCNCKTRDDQSPFCANAIRSGAAGLSIERYAP